MKEIAQKIIKEVKEHFEDSIYNSIRASTPNDRFVGGEKEFFHEMTIDSVFYDFYMVADVDAYVSYSYDGDDYNLPRTCEAEGDFEYRVLEVNIIDKDHDELEELSKEVFNLLIA